MYDPVLKKNIDTNLEALRGYAALFVVFAHIIYLRGAFSGGYTIPWLIVFQPSAHLFVLVFFVLSGYVISASNQQSLAAGKIGAYLKKRFVRLYPIYFIAMLITLAVAIDHYTAFQIVSNFALLQVLLTPPFRENGAAWSLHFEVFYYLLFIPVSYFRLNPLWVTVLSAVLALANFYFYPNPHTPLLSSYLFGFTFWMGGLCIARYAGKKEEPANYNVLLSAVFFLLALDHLVTLSGLPEVFDHLSYGLFNQHLLYPVIDGSKIILKYKDLAFLPYCMYFVIVFSGRRVKYQQLFFAVLQLPIIFSLVLIVRNFIDGNHHMLATMVPVAYYLISMALLLLKGNGITWISKTVIKLGAWLGSISYAMYIIHHQLLFAFGRFNFGAGSPVGYVVKIIIFLSVVIGLSYLLERKFQPWVKKFFV